MKKELPRRRPVIPWLALRLDFDRALRVRRHGHPRRVLLPLRLIGWVCRDLTTRWHLLGEALHLIASPVIVILLLWHLRHRLACFHMHFHRPLRRRFFAHLKGGRMHLPSTTLAVVISGEHWRLLARRSCSTRLLRITALKSDPVATRPMPTSRRGRTSTTLCVGPGLACRSLAR